MSSFIAQKIRFNTEFTTFELYGDDDNVFPKFNRWTKEIPITDLLRELDGGMTKLSQSGYPAIHKAVSEAQKEFTARFGEYDWDTNKKSIWHWPYMVQENQISAADKIYFADIEYKFISSIKSQIKPRTTKRSVATVALCLF